ncbi:MAG TPA: CPBP family intramembrane glutamic endopeptidase [Dongiaceae bacterium]|nr:CPBP family intramembrane glutamic endopeptidase [Dongiaceae bacterium]
MANAAVRVQRRAAIVLGALTLAESIPIVESLAGVRVLGFWPLAQILTSPSTALGWALAALVAIAFVALTAARNAAMRARLTTFGALKPLALALAVVSGITEELFFRGVVMDVLARHAAGSLGQIVISAALFGAVHVVWVGFTGPRGVLGVVGATTLLGAALAIVYLGAGRSVVPCVVAHAAINAVLEPWLVLTAVERRWGARSAA